jgi:abortive infection bacteriophage resistance protein
LAKTPISAKKPYKGSMVSCEQELKRLKKLGLIIGDEDRALHMLEHYNHHRLRPYWYLFEANHKTRKFIPGITFEDILRLYDFDRRLRLIVLDAIERIEVSVKSQWAYKMGDFHGPHAHLDKSISIHKPRWTQNKNALIKEVGRANDIFIANFKKTYSDELPPIWTVCEAMSLGLLSKWYSNLKPLPTRSAISNVYGLDEEILESWLHHLTVLRNICAHHSRLWNNKFTAIPKHTRKKPARLIGEFMVDPRLYNSFVILLHMMDVMMIENQWRERLVEVLLEHKDWLPEMGFPDDWQSRGIWADSVL